MVLLVQNTTKLYPGPTIQSRPCRLWPSLLKFFSFAIASNDLKDLEEDQKAHYILNHLEGQDIYVVHTDARTLFRQGKSISVIKTGFSQQTGCPGMVPPPPTVLQWLLVWILHREIIAYISELRTQNRLVGLEFDGNSPSWV